LEDLMIDPAALFDDDAAPDVRVRAAAEQIAGAINAGELDVLAPDTKRLMEAIPFVLLHIAGQLYAAQRRSERLVTLHPAALSVIQGGKR
jgi:hypothetical protein